MSVYGCLVCVMLCMWMWMWVCMCLCMWMLCMCTYPCMCTCRRHIPTFIKYAHPRTHAHSITYACPKILYAHPHMYIHIQHIHNAERVAFTIRGHIYHISPPFQTHAHSPHICGPYTYVHILKPTHTSHPQTHTDTHTYTHIHTQTHTHTHTHAHTQTHTLTHTHTDTFYLRA